ncbi:MAG: pyridoxamine 5'-phosphate oxidase family protein [Candidatus Dormibacteria bacterium]
MPEEKAEAESLQELIDLSWERAGVSLRAAWPEERRMTGDPLLAFCQAQRHCVLGVATEGRAPLLVPVSFHLAPGGTIWLPTGPGAVRLLVLRKNPRATVIVGQALSDDHRVVLASGRTELVESSALPPGVAGAAESKLGGLRWAEWWIRLLPVRLLGYDAGSAGSLRTSPG